MGAIGGDILEITYNHPTIGSGVIYPKAGEDSTIDPGGFRSDDDNNGVDGGGNMIDKMNRNRWSVETSIAWDMNTNLELEKLILLAGSPVRADYTISHVSGTTWGGKGKPVGDLAGAGNTGTFKLKLAGGQTLKKIV